MNEWRNKTVSDSESAMRIAAGKCDREAGMSPYTGW